MKKVEDLTAEEKSEIHEAINDRFTQDISEPRRIQLETFMEDVLFIEREQILEKTGLEIQVYDITFYANKPLTYFEIEPTEEFVSTDFIEKVSELRLPFYNSFTTAEDILKEYNLDYSSMFYYESFDPAYLWENGGDLEMEFIQSCWFNVQKKHNLDIQVFLRANDGTDYFDLSSRSDYDSFKHKISVEEYLASKNIFPKKYLNEKRKWWSLLKRN
ncbi:MAG: hypothetical protein AB8B56_21650 [Crocinitomicaceae bacterium]